MNIEHTQQKRLSNMCNLAITTIVTLAWIFENQGEEAEEKRKKKYLA